MDDIQSVVSKFISDSIDSEKLENKRQRALTYQDFYQGRHWGQDEYDYYKSKGVEPITVNRCKAIVKTFLGMYLNNRQSIRVRPRKAGSEACAQVWTEVIKHAEDIANADYIYSEAFQRASIDGESYIVMDIDKSKTENGQPIINAMSLFDVDIDPNCDTYNINDDNDYAKFAIVKRWLDKDFVEKLYPKKDVNEIIKSYTGDDSLMGIDVVLGGLLDDNDSQKDAYLEDDELKKQYRVRIRYVWWKEITDGVIIYDNMTGASKKIAKSSDKYKNIKSLKNDRFRITEQPVFVLHKTTMLGKTMLDDVVSPFGDEIYDLPVFRFSPYYDDGYAMGQIDDIISLNREENIYRTQITKILNKTANSGWKVGSTANRAAADELKNYGDVDGYILDVSKFGNSAEKIEPNQLPVGLFTMSQKFEDDVKKVSGIDDASMGIDSGKAESGRAISLKQQQNSISVEIAFSNFYYTLELFGKYLLDVIRRTKCYTDDEIKAIVSESSLIDTEMIEKARMEVEYKIGAGLPQPKPLMPIMPQQLAAVRPEDRPMVLDTMKQGLEGAELYNKRYPYMKANYDEMVKLLAIEKLMEKLRSDVIYNYGVKVTVSPTAPTERMLRFMELDSLNKAYPGIIPPDILIDTTDLPNKEELKARYQQMAQQPQLQGATA